MLIYLTTNKEKAEEANRFFVKKYGFNIEIKKPNFEVIEIQAKTSSEVAALSAKYAADKLGQPVLKSDTALYIDYLGGLPGPYNAYFDKQIGVEKFLGLMKDVDDRRTHLEHSFAYCEPDKKPVFFSGGSNGIISHEARGVLGRWHDKFYIPDGETETLSQLREKDPEHEARYWGTAIKDFAEWYSKYLSKQT